MHAEESYKTIPHMSRTLLSILCIKNTNEDESYEEY